MKLARHLSELALACASCAGPPHGPEAPEPPRSVDLAAERLPRPAPAMSLTAAETVTFARLPARARAVPVVLFHDVCPEACPADALYALPRAELIRMFLMFAAAGYTTITPAQYVRLMHGDDRGLPERPILVTFDDGHANAYLQADAILERLGARVTMFVITDRPETRDSRFVRWSEWRAATATGRWDVQLHAHAGHVKIPARAGDGARRPSYAVRAYDPAEGGHLESFAAWQARTEGDIRAGRALLAARLDRAYEPLLFAVPFGDYGQKPTTNDPAIAPELRAFMDRSFAYWFTQVGNADFATPGGTTHEQNRYTILGTTKAETVYAWLKRRASPGP